MEDGRRTEKGQQKEEALLRQWGVIGSRRFSSTLDEEISAQLNTREKTCLDAHAVLIKAPKLIFHFVQLLSCCCCCYSVSSKRKARSDLTRLNSFVVVVVGCCVFCVRLSNSHLGKLRLITGD